MKRTIISLSLILLCFSINAQDARTLIDQNPDRAANNMHSYEYVATADTPAPKGYKPFYITHYGRHGSRYNDNSTFSKAALQGLEDAKAAGILTPKGETLLGYINTITEEHKGMEGSLSPRGGREHRQIAERMVKRFPQVFSSKQRTQAGILTSTVQRSIISMANFITSLKQNDPSIDFSFMAGNKFQPFMAPSFKYENMGAFMASGRNKDENHYDFSRLYSVLFTDTAKANEIIANQQGFVSSIFSAGGLCQDLDFLGIDIFRNYFTTDELVYLWKNGNDMLYLLWANSKEQGDVVTNTIKPLLRDILDKAAEAVKPESNKLADFRFGHDTGVLPLFSLIGIDDPNGVRHPYNEAHETWYSFQQVPMGTNFQMILYKNKKGDMLAKILYNEKEVTIPALHTDIAPYYKWDTLRNYLEEKCK